MQNWGSWVLEAVSETVPSAEVMCRGEGSRKEWRGLDRNGYKRGWSCVRWCRSACLSDQALCLINPICPVFLCLLLNAFSATTLCNLIPHAMCTCAARTNCQLLVRPVCMSENLCWLLESDLRGVDEQLCIRQAAFVCGCAGVHVCTCLWDTRSSHYWLNLQTGKWQPGQEALLGWGIYRRQTLLASLKTKLHKYIYICIKYYRHTSNLVTYKQLNCWKYGGTH